MPWKSLRAAAAGDLDFATARTAVLRLVVRGQDLELVDGVHVQRDVLGAVRSGVDVGGAVNRQVVLVRPSAVDADVAEAAGTGNLEVARCSRRRG